MWFYITLINSLSNSINTIFFSIYFLDRSELKKKRRLEYWPNYLALCSDVIINLTYLFTDSVSSMRLSTCHQTPS